MDRMKVQKKLEDYQSSLKPENNERAFYLAICYVQLGNYPEAQFQFERSVIAMFNPPQLWKITSQPNWLTDICVLSGRTDLFPQVLKELDLYKQIPSKGDSPGAMYPYGLMELLLPSGWDISKSIEVLLQRPKYKDLYAIGETLTLFLRKHRHFLLDNANRRHFYSILAA